jgi:hypothetical protein
MVEKSKFDKLTKDQLVSKIEEMKSKTKKDRWINYISTVVAIILGIILIFSYVLPAFSGISVIKGGKNIDNGIWEINFITTGFIPVNNIVLHVKFLDTTAKINYGTIFFSVSPDVKKLERDNEFEYKWNSYKGEIEILVEISSTYTLSNKTFVQISTDKGLAYEWWGT